MYKRIENVILFIAKNFNAELTLDTLAKECGLSKFHFHRIFKLETGQTPLQYVNKLRLEFAAHFLIMYPENKLTDVTFECGYISPAVFTRSFKEFYKISPSAYRKKYSDLAKDKPKEKENLIPLPVTYLPHQKVSVLSSNLTETSLSELYKKLIQQVHKTSHSIGFYVDTPFHKDLDKCRYYAGFTHDVLSTHHQFFLEIESGYYTYLTVRGNFEAFSKQIIAFKKNIIDPSPYYIASLIAFERIELPVKASEFHYFEAERTIYLKIKRK